MADINRKIDDPGTGTSTANGGANNPNTGKNTTDADKVVDSKCGGIGIAYADKKADNLDTDINIANRRRNNLNINTVHKDADKETDRQIAANNKACTSLFSLYKTPFILIFFFELKTISTFLFVSISSSMTLIKQKTPFSKYLLIKL